MEANEQELRRYLLKRIDDYCCGEMCGDCDIREKSELPTSKLLELYFAAYPDMKPTPEITEQVIDYLKKETKRQFVEEAEMTANEQMKNEFAELFNNQRAKADYGKEQLTLVPRRIIHDICAIRMYGNEKYPDGGPDNWKRVAKERYREAAYRHFLAYLDDPQGKDKESGFPHLWHLACNIAFLCEFEDGCAQLKEDDGEIRCKYCLYFDEDEDGEHCTQCKRNYCDMFVRKTHDR